MIVKGHFKIPFSPCVSVYWVVGTLIHCVKWMKGKQQGGESVFCIQFCKTQD